MIRWDPRPVGCEQFVLAFVRGLAYFGWRHKRFLLPISSFSTNLLNFSWSDSPRTRVSLALSLSYRPTAGRVKYTSSICSRYCGSRHPTRALHLDRWSVIPTACICSSNMLNHSLILLGITGGTRTKKMIVLSTALSQSSLFFYVTSITSITTITSGSPMWRFSRLWIVWNNESKLLLSQLVICISNSQIDLHATRYNYCRDTR